MNDQTKESEVFRQALTRLKIKEIDGPRLFNVTRKTVYNWITGRTKIPESAFITLLDIENRDFFRTKERLADIQAIAARINSGNLQIRGRKNDE